MQCIGAGQMSRRGGRDGGDEMDMDDAYSNGKYIAGAELFVPRWQGMAAAFRASARARLGLAYGDGARQRFDLFLPEAVPRGLMVFVHGGYWRAFEREMWSHLAAGGVARGWAVALPGYDLCPAVRIADITRQVAVAVVMAAREIPGPVVVAGHSAGGHLAARLACDDVILPIAARLVRVMPISPLADLRPLMQTAMNADFGLDLAAAEAESPVLHRRRAGVGCAVWVGAAERPAFLDQARWLGAAWGVPVTVEPARHHFDVIDGLARPDSAMMTTLLGGL